MVVIASIANTVTLPSYLSDIVGSFSRAWQLLFVITGFSLCYSYFERLNDQGMVKKYYIRGFFRIAPLFYLMIIIWGTYFYFRYGVHITPFEYLTNFSLSFNLYPGLQWSIVPGGWFIGVLCIFYLIFPVFVVLVRRALTALALVIGILFISSYYYLAVITQPGLDSMFPYMSFITQLPFFLVGILCYFILRNRLNTQASPKKRSDKVVGGSLIVIAVILFCLLAWKSPLYNFLINVPFILGEFYIWALVFGCLLLGLILYPWKGIANRVTKFLGDRSYSIYLLHLLFNELSFGLYTGILVLVGNLSTSFLLYVIYIFIVVIAGSCITYQFLEQPALKYGTKYLQKYLLNE